MLLLSNYLKSNIYLTAYNLFNTQIIMCFSNTFLNSYHFYSIEKRLFSQEAAAFLFYPNVSKPSRLNNT